MAHPEEIRESEGSINDRGSALALEEGSINAIRPAINAGAKCLSAVKAEEEFKDSAEPVVNAKCDSYRSGSGSGSGRQFSVINGFQSLEQFEDGNQEPFASVVEPMKTPGQMNCTEDDDEDCNLDPTEELGLPQAPVEHAGVQNKNPAAFGQSFK